MAFVLCPTCGCDNPAANKFCGICGATLQTNEPVTAQVEKASPADARQEAHEPRVAGPSFLGLSDAPEESSDPPAEYSYLLEDEPHHGRAATYIVILVLLAVGVAVAVKWSTIRNYVASIKAQQPAAPQSAPAPSENVGANAVPPEPPPVPNQQQTTAANTPAPAMSADEEKKQAAALPQNAADANVDQPVSKYPPAAIAKMPAASTAASAPEKTAEPASPPADEAADAEPAPTPAPKKPSAAHLAPKASTPQPDDRMLNLAEKYLYGRGAPKDCGQALVYMKAAARNGNPKAMGHLGAMYATGQCVSLDRAMAYSWFTQAKNVDPNNPWFDRNRQMLWRDMSPDERVRSGGTR